ncbi:MAG TPA: YciI family protein [Candidatus Baltobacteraceae bacterium]|nr:YciI family protein [Candidatus Baltobacteraceae bacterium]
MRFLVLVRATKETEAGILPAKELFTAMGRFNEEMARAGVMLAADGLQPSSKGAARINFDRGRRAITDGPFAETKELIAGFWIIEVRSKEEALEWMSRAPFDSGEIELRQIYEFSDFPAEVFSPEDAARIQSLRDELQRK